MDAIVTAGGIPQPGEPLYEYTLGASKAMLDVVGKPMIQWVLDALEGATNSRWHCDHRTAPGKRDQLDENQGTHTQSGGYGG